MVVVPIGGGGLISGIATAIKAKRPSVRSTASRPRPPRPWPRASARRPDPRPPGGAVGGRRHRRQAPRRADLRAHPPLRGRRRHRLEDEIRAAIVRLLETGKTVTEGAAAVTLAAMAGRPDPRRGGAPTWSCSSRAPTSTSPCSRASSTATWSRAGAWCALRTHVPDRPGALAELLQVIGRHGGNVVRIQHDRVFMHAGFWEAQVDITLETRNAEHIDELVQALRDKHYEVKLLE